MGIAKRRWSSVRSYLCGDDYFSSVLAEEDSASLNSSEPIVTKPNTEDTPNQETGEEKHNSTTSLFRREDAAMIIQSAFRGFLGRRSDKKVVVVSESPSRESMGTSVEVQTGNSVQGLSVEEQLMADHVRIQHKARSQVLRLKEDWDDSTVSSNISRTRIQNKVEATTRRERALAYAFSQQLRICAKKKTAKCDSEEANMGWKWLERWMATRIPDSPSFQTQFDQINNNNHLLMAKKRFFDVTGEEKESCGSNEVPVQFDTFSVASLREKHLKNRLKATTTVSKRKPLPRNHSPKHHAKVSKTECTVDTEKHKRHKQKQLVFKNKTDNSSEELPINKSPDLPMANEILKTCM